MCEHAYVSCPSCTPSHHTVKAYIILILILLAVILFCLIPMCVCCICVAVCCHRRKER